MDNQFTRIMSARSDEQLIEIITSDRDKYNSEAIEAAEKEISKRDIDSSSYELTVEKLEFQKQRSVKTASNSAGSGLRFINYLIDVIAGYLFATVVAVVIAFIIPLEIIAYPLAATILVVTSFFVYYILMEAVFQKTLGKFITRTKVVTINGDKPREQDIIKRTFCRLIPFDHLSFLFAKDGFHDHFSKTKVIKDN